MKSFKDIIKETVNPPKSTDELRFIKQHKGEVSDVTPQDEDGYTKGIKKAVRRADKTDDKADYDKAYAKEEVDLEEKAESQAQAISARIALAVKRGKLPKSKLQGASKDMYDGMTEKELEDYSKAKKGAPQKVEEARVVKGGYRDEQGKYHPPKTREDMMRDWAKKRKEIHAKTRAALSEDPWEEIPMMQRQLEFICYAADEMIDQLEEVGDPEEWFQNKLAHIHGQMKTLYAYMEGQARMDSGMYEETQLDEGIKAGNLSLNDGSTVKVKAGDAAIINMAMKEMKKENRDKLTDILMRDKEGFDQILRFTKAAL